jgi:creatinine amidohydrolase
MKIMGKMLQYMTWEEAKETFKGTKMAIIPTGSTEQHGPHLPLGTDFLVAEYFAKKVAEKADVVVTPVVSVGFAHYHTCFEGTLSVNPEVLSSYIQGIVDSLISYGITHILFINGHGGNIQSLANVCRNLRIRGITAAYVNWWEVIGRLNKNWQGTGHGDSIETSLMLLISPENVKLNRAAVPINKKLTDKIQTLGGAPCEFKKGIVDFYLMMNDTTDTGDMLEYSLAVGANVDYTISAASASIEKGKEIAEAMVNYIVDFTEEFKKIKFKPTNL